MIEPRTPSESGIDARRVLATVAKLALFAALASVALPNVQWSRSFALMASAPPVAFAIAYAAELFGTIAAARRWETLLDAVGVRVPRAELLRLTFASQALNLVLPSTLGGDAYRVYETRADADGLVRSAGVVIWERFCGLLAVCLLASFAVAISDFKHREPELAVFTAALTATLLATAWGVHRPWVARLATRAALRLGLNKIARTLCSVSRSVRNLPRRGRVFATLVGYSLVMKLSVAAQYAALAWGLGAPLEPTALLVFLPLQMLVAALPISVAGVGPREANTVLYFTHLGLDESHAAALAVLILAWLYLSGLPYALAFCCKPLRPATA